MFRKMPVILLLLIAAILLLNQWIPPSFQSFFYALSLTIKSIMLFLLPALIFMLLFKTAQGSTKLIIGIFLAVICSNFLSTMISYQLGRIVYPFDLSITLPQEATGLSPLWTFMLPKWIPNDLAMFSGILLGIFLPASWCHKITPFFEKGIELLLKFFLKIIPFFIVGFIFKFIHDKTFENVFSKYALIFLIVGCSQISYTLFLYLVASRFRISSFMTFIKNMFPAAIAGFSSMSSAAAMPLTLLGVEKNTKEPKFSQLVIPSTVSIHLIGDCFAIPIFAFAVMKSFGMAEPSFSTYLIFSFYFVLAKFSVAAVPGGGILVMLPILENHLGFNSSMDSVIFAFYVLFDPLITCTNILGNGAFALIVSKIFKKTKFFSSEFTQKKS